MSRNHRRVNENNNNALPANVITMPMHLWTDPTFWQNENEPAEGEYVMMNGKKIPNSLTLEELGLVLSQNNVYSDPGEYNVVSPLALPPPAIVGEPHNRITRSLAMPKKRRTAKKSKSRARTATRNNRFGFKKAFGALKEGLKKLTGKSRKNRRI